MKENLDVHEFGMAIQENKHLYTEEEYMHFCGEWLIMYEKYLTDLRNEIKGDN